MAGTFLRLPVNAIHTGDTVPVVDFCALATAQAEDPDIPNLPADSSLLLQHVPLALSDRATICVMSLLVYSALWCLNASTEQYLTIFTLGLTLEFGHYNAWSHRTSSGLDSTLMLDARPAPVCSVNMRKFIGTTTLHHAHSLPLMHNLTKCI